LYDICTVNQFYNPKTSQALLSQTQGHGI